MPYITTGEIQTLIEVENYLGDKENWSENTCKIWQVVETLLARKAKDNEKVKNIMRRKRAIDKNYGRGKE